ncbi:MAG: DegT/DnrJ/EryC1/StrS family aminotransferase [Candidatus Omnitrophota bacterium]
MVEKREGNSVMAGGKPAKMIPIARPFLDSAEAKAAARVIASGWVTQGPEVALFEREFAAAVGARYACAVSSCTTALHIALLALGVRAQDEVVTVSHSFIATANSIRYCGAVPVFVDICPDTFNIDPGRIERAITRRTRALLCVHQMGMPCDLEAILKIARRHSLPVIEDAACAIGSQIRRRGTWEKIGRPHGDIACFSFHPRKIITTGDGGMLTSADAALDRRFRLLRQHGMSVTDTARHRSTKAVFESYDLLGYNYRMTDLQAALGREQLLKLPRIVRERRTLACRYEKLLAGIPGLQTPCEPAWARSNWQSYCVRLSAGISQRKVLQDLLDEGIAARRGIMCAHREGAYRRQRWSCGLSRRRCGCTAGACERLRESEEAQDHSILLPLFYGMKTREQEHVAQKLRSAIKR